jgi:hypothetical protein
MNKYKVGEVYRWAKSYFQVIKIAKNVVHYELLAPTEGSMTNQDPGKSWFEFGSILDMQCKKESINAEVYRILYG